VGHSGPEENIILSVHKSYKGAFEAWNNLRISLLKRAKNGLEYRKKDAEKSLKEGKWSDGKPFTQETIDYFKNVKEKGDDMYLEMIKKLSCKDPDKIDNYPHETPYIEKMEVEE
jgi:hypothetical protein